MTRKLWVVGETMPLGSDDSNAELRRQYNVEYITEIYPQLHVENQGRNPHFGPNQDHVGTVVKADQITVHMLCSCEATWTFPQPGTKNRNEDTYLTKEYQKPAPALPRYEQTVNPLPFNYNKNK